MRWPPSEDPNQRLRGVPDELEVLPAAGAGEGREVSKMKLEPVDLARVDEKHSWEKADA